MAKYCVFRPCLASKRSEDLNKEYQEMIQYGKEVLQTAMWQIKQVRPSSDANRQGAGEKWKLAEASVNVYREDLQITINK